MKVRKVVWRDSALYLQQEAMQDFQVRTLTSIGYVIQEDETKIVLAGDLVDDEFRRVIVIPKENIIV